jgi:4-amino-4-deoxy-L-arabinose transferase-like glycosyltransferase
MNSCLRDILALFLLFVFIFLFLMPLFEAPFERDQGAYATIARGWMNGDLPYADLWDNKGPLLYLWYMASFALLGEQLAAPRILAALAAALSMLFLWAAARRLFSRPIAMLAAILYTLSFANLYLQVTANAAVFMLLPLTAGFWAFTRGMEKNPIFWYMTAGAFTSLAVFTRQSAVLTFAGYGLWLAWIWLNHPERRSRQAAALAAMSAGAVLGAIPFALYFARHGALHDLWFAMFGFNISWVAEQSFWLKLVPPLFIEPGPLAGGLIFWILMVIGVVILWKRGDWPGRLVIVFLLVSELAAQTMGKGSAHYSIQLLPGAAVAASFGSIHVMNWWKNGSSMLKAGLVTAGAVTVTAIVFAYAQPTATDRFVVQYTYRDYARDAVDAPPIARAIAAGSTADECVYEWGRSSQIYFLADRRPCTRWFYDRPYEVNPSMILEVMTDLHKRQPAVIFITGEFPPPKELAAFIEAGYAYTHTVGYAKLFEKIRE